MTLVGIYRFRLLATLSIREIVTFTQNSFNRNCHFNSNAVALVSGNFRRSMRDYFCFCYLRLSASLLSFVPFFYEASFFCYYLSSTRATSRSTIFIYLSELSEHSLNVLLFCHSSNFSLVPEAHIGEKMGVVQLPSNVCERCIYTNCCIEFPKFFEHRNFVCFATRTNFPSRLPMENWEVKRKDANGTSFHIQFSLVRCFSPLVLTFFRSFFVVVLEYSIYVKHHVSSFHFIFTLICFGSVSRFYFCLHFFHLKTCFLRCIIWVVRCVDQNTRDENHLFNVHCAMRNVSLQ